MNYEKLTVGRIGERIKSNLYKNVTAARRAVGKAHFGARDREFAHRLVNQHFKAELAMKAMQPKRKRRRPTPKAKRRVALPRAARPPLDWDPIGSHVGTKDIDELADAIADRILVRIVERIVRALDTTRR